MSKRIVVTGTYKDAAAFARRLQKAGFEAAALATIRITKKTLSKASAAALKDIGSYDYLLFTSAYAARFFAEALRDLKTRKPRGIRIAAVGPSTARELRAAGLPVHIVPKEFSIKELARKLKTIRGKRMLFPRSATAPGEAIAALRKQGAIVTPVLLYTTTSIAAPKKTFRDLLNDADCIVFMSPSGVKGFAKNLTGTILKESVFEARALCIGPTTAAAAAEAEFRHIVIAKSSTTDGIIKALQRLS